jgi:hypothetical protein
MYQNRQYRCTLFVWLQVVAGFALNALLFSKWGWKVEWVCVYRGVEELIGVAGGEDAEGAEGASPHSLPGQLIRIGRL